MSTTSFLNRVGAAVAAAAVTLMRLVLAAGCNLASSAKKQLPPLGELRTLEPGISFTEVVLLRGKEETSKLWIYLPSPAPTAKLPCIVIAPAGTPLSYGIKLQQGDRREHLPYVRAGFAVIAYEIDGAFDPHGAPDIRMAIRDFRTADAGVANAKVAIDYALRRVGVDSNRLYVAGHSSAATLALQVAARDKRVRGVIAYAPVTDVAKHLEGHLANLDILVPGTFEIPERVLTTEPRGIPTLPGFSLPFQP